MSEEPELKIEVRVNLEEEVDQEKQVIEEVCVNDLVVEPLAKLVAESVVDLVDVSGAVFVEEFEAKVAVEVCVDVFEVVQEEVLVAAIVEYPDAKEVIQMVVRLVEEVAALMDETEKVVVDELVEGEEEVVDKSVEVEEEVVDE
jgi:hypothetical protein